MNIAKYVPNAVTLLNLLCGCIAVIFAVHNNFVLAAIFVFSGIFFDFFDGFLARKLNVQSPLGVQLDSLADMITSGLVPGIVMYKLLMLSVGTPEIEDATAEWNAAFHWYGFKQSIVPLFGLAITMASAYRLGKFNIDLEQQSYFKGLPTPANTLLILSLPLILEFQSSEFLKSLLFNTWFLLIVTALSCYLLNSSIKLFALKFKDYSFSNNKIRYILLLLSVIFLIVFHFAAIPLIIVTYIGLSLIDNLSTK
ncbi:MAG: phosphatidylserine synthase [Bacteroidetes bacterium MedPE-SWsnd-G2]|nr:MAG: phosphatidylserine synthase [Bacteroidetes bacterium MedPE-SWsnd-G2]